MPLFTGAVRPGSPCSRQNRIRRHHCIFSSSLCSSEETGLLLPGHVPCSPSSPSWNPRTNSTCLGICSLVRCAPSGRNIFSLEHLSSAFLKPKCLRPWDPSYLKQALRAGDVAQRQDVCSACTSLGLNLNTSLALQIRGVMCVGNNTEI